MFERALYAQIFHALKSVNRLPEQKWEVLAPQAVPAFIVPFAGTFEKKGGEDGGSEERAFLLAAAYEEKVGIYDTVCVSIRHVRLKWSFL